MNPPNHNVIWKAENKIYLLYIPQPVCPNYHLEVINRHLLKDTMAVRTFRWEMKECRRRAILSSGEKWWGPAAQFCSRRLAIQKTNLGCRSALMFKMQGPETQSSRLNIRICNLNRRPTAACNAPTKPKKSFPKWLPLATSLSPASRPSRYEWATKTHWRKKKIKFRHSC